jgi:hypothetical protein
MIVASITMVTILIVGGLLMYMGTKSELSP